MRFPVYLVDFGEAQPSYTVPLLHDQPFYLNVEKKDSNKYTYCVHGRSVMYLVGPQGTEMTPQFSSVFDASEKDHSNFQKELKKIKVWMLIIKTSVNSHFIIDEAGMVQQYFETPRGNVINR